MLALVVSACNTDNVGEVEDGEIDRSKSRTDANLTVLKTSERCTFQGVQLMSQGREQSSEFVMNIFRKCESCDDLRTG